MTFSSPGTVHPAELEVVTEGSGPADHSRGHHPDRVAICHPGVIREAYLSPRETHLEDRKMQPTKRPERRQALQEAKLAVRAYARDPSQANADAVEVAWRTVRQLDSIAKWREPEAARPSRLQ
jgi:hypothetical protein